MPSYLVRAGKVRHQGAYWSGEDPWWSQWRALAWVWNSRAVAVGIALAVEGRVVRVKERDVRP